MRRNTRTDLICTAKMPRLSTAANERYEDAVRRWRRRYDAYCDSYIMVDCATFEASGHTRHCVMAYYSILAIDLTPEDFE